MNVQQEAPRKGPLCAPELRVIDVKTMKTSKKIKSKASPKVDERPALNTNPLKKVNSVNGPGICCGFDASDVGSVSTQTPAR